MKKELFIRRNETDPAFIDVYIHFGDSSLSLQGQLYGDVIDNMENAAFIERELEEKGVCQLEIKGVDNVLCG